VWIKEPAQTAGSEYRLLGADGDELTGEAGEAQRPGDGAAVLEKAQCNRLVENANAVPRHGRPEGRADRDPFRVSGKRTRKAVSAKWDG